MTEEETLCKMIAEYEAGIENCKECLRSLHEKLDNLRYGGKRWKPKLGERCFYIDVFGAVFVDNCHGDDIDDKIYAFGNVFPSEEAAEFEVERRKVIAKLSDFAEGDDAVWDGTQLHYWLYYNAVTNRIGYSAGQCYKFTDFYFPSEEAAKAAVEAVGEERVKKYYLRVKE